MLVLHEFAALSQVFWEFLRGFFRGKGHVPRRPRSSQPGRCGRSGGAREGGGAWRH